MKNKKYIYIVSVFAVMLISLVGISYAYFAYQKIGVNQKFTAGKVSLNFSEGTNELSLTNIFPETAEEARSRTDNVITFTISGKNTNDIKDLYYEIMLNVGDAITGKSRFNAEHLVFDLVEIDENNNKNMVVNAMNYETLNKTTIWVNTIGKNTSDNISRTYQLRMWLSDEVIISDSDNTADYDTSTFKNSYANVKVFVNGDYEVKKLGSSLANLIDETLLLTEADEDGTMFVTGNNPNANVSQTGNSNENKIKANSLVNFNKNISSKTVDTTQDIANYVWYSGKMWRIFAKNNNNSLSLITQNSITNISWENTCSSVEYTNSQVRKWLNNEFLNTLENNELLVSKDFDYTLDETNDKTKPATGKFVNDKVGLITSYQYEMTGGKDGFLNIKYIWWTMTPSMANTSNLWQIGGDGSEYSNVSCDPRGIRPVITLSSSTAVTEGDGSPSNPYIIKGDKEVAENNEKLNNRVSGEFISFNDSLYRIIGTETIGGTKFTKITMADYSINRNSINSSQNFGASLTFSKTSGIGLYLDTWYNGTDISKTYKDMIATNSDGIVWYTGNSSGIYRDYTLNKSGDAISATIGLPYYGEMFASQFGEAHYQSYSFWTMTKYADSTAWVISDYDTGSGQGASQTFAVRPVMYLKSNVIISDIDGDGEYGNGTKLNPYEIKLS